MAQTTDPRPRPWLAFVAGAVAMLAILLIWMAWRAAQTTVTTALRANLPMPRAALPIPRTPPPEGPHLPKPPVPTPR
jgi:hypothetical protein